jgi:3',5'-cyclic AMP phosphodiesterase CpdA
MLIILFSAWSFSNPTPSGTLWTPRDQFNISAYPSIVKSTDFRILQLTDMHINGPNSDVIDGLAMAEVLIVTLKPDLVIVTGDICGGPLNGVFAQTVIDFFEQFNISYTFALGNHDGEGDFDDDDVARTFSTGRYSLFSRGPGSIHGWSNSAVNLVDPSGRVVYSLITIDSNRYRDYTTSATTDYDYIYPDQGVWYKWFVNGLAKQQGRQIKSMLFYHIPLPEINDVRAELKKVDPDAEAFSFRENPCPSGQNAGFWGTVQAVNSTTHMFFGHDHTNLLDYVWGGVHWIYGLKTGPSSYHDNDRLGGTLITIGQDGLATIQFVYQDYVRASEGIRKLFAKVRRPKVQPK